MVSSREALLKDDELQKIIKFAKKLERYHKTGEIAAKSYEAKWGALNTKFDAFRQRKLGVLRTERDGLSGELELLREDFRAKRLNEESYAKKASTIRAKIVDIDTRAELLESLELSDYMSERPARVREGIPKPLLGVIVVSTVVTLLGILFFSGIFLSLASKLPFGLDSLGSIFIIGILVLSLIGIVMSSLMLWVSAKLAGIGVSYFLSLKATLAIAVVTFALNVFFTIALIPALFLKFLLPLVVVARIIVSFALYLWILKSFFNTTWKKSALVGLIPVVIAALLLLLLGFFLSGIIGSIRPPTGGFPISPGQMPPFKMPPGLDIYVSGMLMGFQPPARLI